MKNDIEVVQLMLVFCEKISNIELEIIFVDKK